MQRQLLILLNMEMKPYSAIRHLLLAHSEAQEGEYSSCQARQGQPHHGKRRTKDGNV